MSSICLYLVVEGVTEQTFVREVLAPELAISGIYASAILIGKAGHKGGNVCFQRAVIDISKLLKQQTNSLVSTMLDYFRIDTQWPGYAQIQQKQNTGSKFSTLQKAEMLEEETIKAVTSELPNINVAERFIPYFSMHEFEALLFSDAGILAKHTHIPLHQIQAVLAPYATPEEINNDPKTAPSKRLETLTNNCYRKVQMGTSIAKEIGILPMRQQCPHFDHWLKRLIFNTTK